MSDSQKPLLSETYAKQRLMRILTDLVASDMGVTWSGLAADISVWREVEFSRENFRRLRKGTLGPSNVEIIIQYLEDKHDPNIRDRLRPDAIFDELAQPARDYYFHIPEPNDIDDWNEQILDEFSGVYFCCIAGDAYSYVPATKLRKMLESQGSKTGKEPYRSGLSNTLMTSRTILFLRPTQFGYFHAAEIPLASLVPTSLKTPSQRVFYEGIGVISANTIQIKLRDCLTRIPRTHAITILEKDERLRKQRDGLSFFLAGKAAEVEKLWSTMDEEDFASLKREHDLTLSSEYYLFGKVLHSESPLPVMGNKISRIGSQDLIYLAKPSDFLDRAREHFFLGEEIDQETIRKTLENPLVIGSLNGN